MPRRKGETDQQWMQRLRDFRAERDLMMEQTRAAVTYCNTPNDEGVNMTAFMHLFHPDVPAETVRQMVNDARRRRL